MDIHKPKPWHGVREFLKEYVIIVVGVLTALGAEQTVEWFHWRHEIAETRKVLAGEIGRNIDRLTREQRLGPCLDHRFEDLRRYLAQRGAGDHTPPPAKVGARRGVLRLNANAWEMAKAAQLMAHMPPEDRERYSRLYNEFDFAASQHAAEADALTVVRLVEDAPMLETADWSQVRLAWIRGAAASAQLNANLPAIVEDAKAVVEKGPQPAEAQRNATDRQADVLTLNQDLCRPWYSSAPAAAR